MNDLLFLEEVDGQTKINLAAVLAGLCYAGAGVGIAFTPLLADNQFVGK